MLLVWPEHFMVARTVGIENVDSRPAYRVRLTAEDCHKMDLFFDRESGRHVRTVQRIAYAGEEMDADSRFSNFQAIDGVEVPMTVRRVLVFRGNRMLQEYDFTSVEHNLDLPAELFETPPELAGEG